MPIVFEDDLTTRGSLAVQEGDAEIVNWRGCQAMRLNGLAWLPGTWLQDATIEVDIAAEGPAYPGIAFRVRDLANYQLAYAQPHTSGCWDALQYDPVMHGSNTWQLYNGPAYQQSCLVPTGEWFTMRLSVQGQRAAFSVNGQQPLVVARLANPAVQGLVGLWTHQPAYFHSLRISTEVAVPDAAPWAAVRPVGAASAWYMDGFGVIPCEPDGFLNLNRWLPVALGQVQLVRCFALPEPGQVTLTFGFSDELALRLDDDLVFEGLHAFAGFGGRGERGYLEGSAYQVCPYLPAGVHRIRATLKVTEPYGWGLSLTLAGGRARWLPPEFSHCPTER